MKQKESTKEVLDDTDIAILEHIQKDGRMSNSKLAEKVNLSETPCWRRWKRMEETGYIDGYAAKLNRKKLGFHVAGFTLVTLGNHEVENTEPFEEFVAVTDWIPMCHCIAGGADYMVQVLAKDLEEYFERISSIRRVKGRECDSIEHLGKRVEKQLSITTFRLANCLSLKHIKQKAQPR